MGVTSKIYSRISEKCSNNSMEKENVCYVKYYYEPGLSARNRIATQPPEGTHTNSVPLNRINKVKIFGIILRIKISKPFSNNKEIEAIKMERVTLSTQNASVLHHYLCTCVK
jgi:hypothetical protein